MHGGSLEAPGKGPRKLRPRSNLEKITSEDSSLRDPGTITQGYCRVRQDSPAEPHQTFVNHGFLEGDLRAHARAHRGLRAEVLVHFGSSRSHFGSSHHRSSHHCSQPPVSSLQWRRHRLTPCRPSGGRTVGWPSRSSRRTRSNKGPKRGLGTNSTR